MSSGQKVSASEAAERAAANYVYTAAYKQGVQAGWEAGWAAAFGGCATREQQAGSIVDNDREKFEMSDAWVQLFVAGEERRCKRQRNEKEESDQDRNIELDLGGIADTKRRQRLEQLYGQSVGRIVQMETTLAADFSLVCASRAPLWPVISLKDSERTMDGAQDRTIKLSSTAS